MNKTFAGTSSKSCRHYYCLIGLHSRAEMLHTSNPLVTLAVTYHHVLRFNSTDGTSIESKRSPELMQSSVKIASSFLGTPGLHTVHKRSLSNTIPVRGLKGFDMPSTHGHALASDAGPPALSTTTQAMCVIHSRPILQVARIEKDASRTS
jgi:hypothetical protein